MSRQHPSEDALELARQVLETEARAIHDLIPTLGADFTRALDVLQHTVGRVIVTGLGKSGIVGRKLSATLSSTGTAAIFLHAAEALHGDLGVVQSDDVVIALSNSGETDELVLLLESIRKIGARLIAITSDSSSTLGSAADVTLVCRVAEEACPMGLAPTASTTATMALGDALAMALSRRKGFKEEHFATLHPGGRLGKQLVRIEALMKSGDALPAIRPDAILRDVVDEISRKRLGMTCVVDNQGILLGVVTDGDLRRHLAPGVDLFSRKASDVMSPRPVTISRNLLAIEALRLMEERRITSVVVVDDGRRVEGVVHLHDLW
jgi:arabinose-5-phosphate isomerase